MIITKQKSFQTILQSIHDEKNIFLFGCEECATQCQTGGEKELSEMKDRLEKEGKTITGTLIVQALCQELDTQRMIRQNKENINKAQGILVFSCGAGIQTLGEYLPLPVHPGCDSLFLGNVKRHLNFSEKCSMCGDCVLDEYGTICPVTRCAKSLLNGPCGGAIGNKCEVNAEVDCAWILIFDQLKKLNKTEKIKKIHKPKNYGAHLTPGVKTEKRK